MLEKIAVALNKEPYELFAITPIKKEWQRAVLTELADILTKKLNETN
jgi:hypothetical protein